MLIEALINYISFFLEGQLVYHKIGDSDCLLKTQDSAKFYNDV